MKFTKKAAVAAGSLAAISMASQDAEATIVFEDGNPIAITAGSGFFGSVEWDVDNQFGTDFFLATSPFGDAGIGSTLTTYNSATIQGNGQGFVGSPVGTPSNTQFLNTLQNLPQGFVVGPTLAAGYTFRNQASQAGRLLLEGMTYYGQYSAALGPYAADGGFVDGENFVGFQFDAGGTTLYGWAKIELGTGLIDPPVVVDSVGDLGTSTPTAADAMPGEILISEWAFDDSGAAIAVGDTGDTVAAIPEPHSLALMAMGAAGVAAWRSRRKKKQPSPQTEEV